MVHGRLCSILAAGFGPAVHALARTSGDVDSRARPGHDGRRHRLAALALALCITGCAGAPGSAIARSTPDSFSPLVKRVLPAVVNIAVTETVSGGEVLRDLPPELRDTPLGREF